MAKKIIIPITDHDDNCTQYYYVEYKLSTDTAYSSFQWYTGNIEINNVLDSATYNVRITRYCCNNVFSSVLTLDVDTTTDSPQLDAPANFVLSLNSPPVSGQILASWDAVTNATGYYGILSTDALFTNIVYYFNTLDPLVSATITGLTSSTEYYGKVQARADGYADSDYSNTDNITAP